MPQTNTREIKLENSFTTYMCKWNIYADVNDRRIRDSCQTTFSIYIFVHVCHVYIYRLRNNNSNKLSLFFLERSNVCVLIYTQSCHVTHRLYIDVYQCPIILYIHSSRRLFYRGHRLSQPPPPTDGWRQDWKPSRMHPIFIRGRLCYDLVLTFHTSARGSLQSQTTHVYKKVVIGFRFKWLRLSWIYIQYSTNSVEYMFSKLLNNCCSWSS